MRSSNASSASTSACLAMRLASCSRAKRRLSSADSSVLSGVQPLSIASLITVPSPVPALRKLFHTAFASLSLYPVPDWLQVSQASQPLVPNSALMPIPTCTQISRSVAGMKRSSTRRSSSETEICSATFQLPQLLAINAALATQYRNAARRRYCLTAAVTPLGAGGLATRAALVLRQGLLQQVLGMVVGVINDVSHGCGPPSPGAR